MDSEKEEENSMTFGDLSPEGKIKAVLAAARKPISREQALNFAGIKIDLLKEDDRAAVEQVFVSTAQEGQAGSLHKIEGSDDFYRELGIESKEGHRAIAEFYMRQMGEGNSLSGSKV